MKKRSVADKPEIRAIRSRDIERKYKPEDFKKLDKESLEEVKKEWSVLSLKETDQFLCFHSRIYKDKLSNEEELAYGTDASETDTDRDGLSDYDEIFVYKTKPGVADTDEDTVNDGDEIALGLDPLNPMTFGVPTECVFWNPSGGTLLCMPDGFHHFHVFGRRC